MRTVHLCTVFWLYTLTNFRMCPALKVKKKFKDFFEVFFFFFLNCTKERGPTHKSCSRTKGAEEGKSQKCTIELVSLTCAHEEGKGRPDGDVPLEALDGGLLLLFGRGLKVHHFSVYRVRHGLKKTGPVWEESVVTNEESRLSCTHFELTSAIAQKVTHAVEGLGRFRVVSVVRTRCRPHPRTKI